MISVSIEAIIPVPIPRFNIDKLPRKQIRLNTLSLLENRNGIQRFNLYGYGNITPTFSIYENVESIENEIRFPISQTNIKILHITLDIDVPEEIEIQHGTSGSIEIVTGTEAIEFHKSNIVLLFEKRIYDYAFAINLSGTTSLYSLHLNEGIIRFRGDNYFHKTKCLNPDFILDAYALSESKQWPVFRSLTLEQVEDWLNNQKGFMDGFGGGKTGRALNSLVNISFQDNYDSSESLFWAMVGLESLFTSGKSGLLEQVRDKSQVLLGHQNSFKKILNEMYNFRSRFVHGDLDFPTPLHLYDSDEIINYYFDVSEALQIAVAVLICSIQELISRGWKGIEFTYSVSESQEED